MVLRRFWVTATAIFVLFGGLFLHSCAPSAENLTDYAEEGFSASVSFRRGGIAYAARVTAGESSKEDGAPPRDLEIVFTAPESMAGISASRRGGECVTACGDLRLEGDVGGWLGLAELLTAGDIGRLVSVEAGLGAAEGRTMAEFLLNDGRRCVIYFDNASGLPISLECEEDEMQIIIEGK